MTFPTCSITRNPRLFLVDEAQCAEEGSEIDPSAVCGDMPRNSKVGFLFAKNNAADRASFNRTVAHELGHGAFAWQHPFDLTEEGISTNNLMDYVTDDDLAYFQWQSTLGLNLTWGFLEGDEEGMEENDSFEKDSYGVVYVTNAIERDENFVAQKVNGKNKCLPQGTEVKVISVKNKLYQVEIVALATIKDKDGNVRSNQDVGYSYSVGDQIYLNKQGCLKKITAEFGEYRIASQIKGDAIVLKTPYSQDYLTKYSDERQYATLETDFVCGNYVRLKDMSGINNNQTNHSGRWICKDLLLNSTHYIVVAENSKCYTNYSEKTDSESLHRGTEMLSKTISGNLNKVVKICDNVEKAKWTEGKNLAKIHLYTPYLVPEDQRKESPYCSRKVKEDIESYVLPYSSEHSAPLHKGEEYSILARCGMYYWVDKPTDEPKSCGEYSGTWVDYKAFEDRDEDVLRGLDLIKGYLGTAYKQEEEDEKNHYRTAKTEVALKYMDCTELAMRFVAEVRGDETVVSKASGSWINYAKKDKCSDYFCFVNGSEEKSFRDIKPGYIFLWYKEDGHVGIVESVILDEDNPDEDLVVVIEAIGSGGARDNQTCKDNASIYGFEYKDFGQVRRSIYKRNGQALACHPGWKGYFSVKKP